jgi:hypothetical protein
MGRCLASDVIAWQGVWAVLHTKQFFLNTCIAGGRRPGPESAGHRHWGKKVAE